MNERYPLLETIRQIQLERRTGSLSLSHDRQIIRIHFYGGLISAVSSNLEEHRLGQYLTREGYIESQKIAGLVHRSLRQKCALGETAVKLQLLEPSELSQLVRQQALQLLRRCLENGFRPARFQSGSTAVGLPIQLGIDSVRLDLARANAQGYVPDSNHRVALKAGQQPSNLPWYPEEIAVLGQLREPRTLDELVADCGLAASQVKKILSVLDGLQMLEVSERLAGEQTALVKRERFPVELFAPDVSNSAYSQKLAVLQDETSFVSEQFKALKVLVNEIKVQRQVRVISVTSPCVQDGKSLIAVNLALCLAQDPGHRIVVVDCDLRNPRVHSLFGIPVEPGLVGYLRHKTVQPYCFIRRFKDLYLITAEGTVANPIEMLSLPRMTELVEYLRGEFDTVILDSPPIQPIADARIVAALADGIIMVVRSGKTAYRSVETALKSLDREKFLGGILNDVKPGSFHTYYKHYYYHYYGAQKRLKKKVKKQIGGRSYLDS